MDEKKEKKDDKTSLKEDEIRVLSLDDLEAVAGGRGGGRHDPPT